MDKTKTLVTDNSLSDAKRIKDSNKYFACLLDVFMLILNMFFTYISYLGMRSENKIFCAIYLGAQIALKGLTHVPLYGIIAKNSESKSMRVLGRIMMCLYTLSILALIIIGFVGKTYDFSSMSDLASQSLGKWAIVGGVIFFLTEALDKFVYMFVDEKIEKIEKIKNEVQNDD